MTARADALRRLQDEIDLRLLDIWATVGMEGSVLGPVLDDDDMRVAFARSLRLAWGMGYNAALLENRAGELGAFARAHPLPPK